MKVEIMKKAVFTAMFLLCFSVSLVHAQKIAIIVTDPKLGKFGEYWNTDRYKYERAYFAYHGYKVFEMEATEETILQAIVDPNVKAITYVGHGGAVDTQGKKLPTLADYTAEQWRESIFRKKYKQYRRQNYSIEEARAKARAKAKNFGKDRVVNYSCNSLVTSDIAHQFVRPGGEYYGSKKLYNPKAVYESLGYLYSLITGEATDSQFFLEEYKVPGTSPNPNAQNSFSNVLNELTDPEHLEALDFNKIMDAINKNDTSLSSSACAKQNPNRPNRGGKYLNYPGERNSGSTCLVCTYSKYGCLVKEEPKVNGNLHGLIKTFNSPKNCSNSFLANTLEIENGRINGTENTYSRSKSGKVYKKSSMPYRNGKRHGKYVRWYENGQKMNLVTYVSGQKIEAIDYNKNGLPYFCTKLGSNGRLNAYSCN